MSIRTQIRKWLQTRGYDIVKTGLPTTIFQAASQYPGLTYHPTPLANYYLPEHTQTDVIANHMRRGVLFEPQVIAEARQWIKPGTCVLDIGANFGQMSIEFAKLVGPTGRVHSFEAQSVVFDVLKKNLEANQLSQVTPHFAAVYDQDGVEMFFPEPDLTTEGTYGCYGINPATGEKGSFIQSITIDSLKIDTPVSFVKIDIQGSDLFAMRGATATIRKHQMPILFEYEEHLQSQFGTGFQDYVAFVDSIGYKFLRTVLRTNYLIVPKNYQAN